MFLKQLVLSAAMLLSVSAFAQQAQPAAEVTGKENPQQAELLDMAGKLVKYGYEKKDALPLIQAVLIYKQLGVTDAKDQAAKTQEGTAPATGITKKDQISLNEAQILADATKFADGDKTLLALIKDAEKSIVTTEKYQIDYEAPDYPTVSPGSGHYDTPTTIRITTGVEGAKIFYTWDGSIPTPSSEMYYGPIDIPEGNNVLSVIVVDKHGMSSNVFRANYEYTP